MYQFSLLREEHEKVVRTRIGVVFIGSLGQLRLPDAEGLFPIHPHLEEQ